ncbi:hypothetical protein D9756_008439 [Leucocoprinus leucothites]|uniref:Protein kinase domain-containing protein n=1 Tax=Leucocoprinus leucothites TaxID=201217 RepID=A0A8H5D2P7_9AGAR|nr:hypothetical protein D9756_008439 [Leucoagaricus leucothites]
MAQSDFPFRPTGSSFRKPKLPPKPNGKASIGWLGSDFSERDWREISGVEPVYNAKNINREDLVIAVMGPPGVGKTTAGANQLALKLQSDGSNNHISALRIIFPDNINVVLAELPSFHNTHRSDLETLVIIADWFKAISGKKVVLSGIVYLHNITDARLTDLVKKNFEMMRKLCGGSFIHKVTLATTVWPDAEEQRLKGDVSSTTIIQAPFEFRELATRERDLIGGYWYPMVQGGSKCFRFGRTKETAWEILNHLFCIQPESPRTYRVRLQEELVEQKKEIQRTDAGRFLHGYMQEVSERQTKLIERMQNELLEAAGQDPTMTNTRLGEFIRLWEEKKRTERDIFALDPSFLGDIRRFTGAFKRRLSARDRTNQPAKETEQHQRSRALISRLIGQNLSLELKGVLETLGGADAQTMIEFLNKVLENDHDLPPDHRRQLLHLFSKTIKSAQVYPKSFQLMGVICNLAGHPKNGGGFGDIFIGKLQRQPVCVKAVRLYGGGAPAQEVLRAHAGEFALWAHMSHPNVLPFYGVHLSKEETQRICIVSPWMEAGNLAEYLKTNPATPRIPLLVDMALGLKYLHGLDIIHSDLKAGNVLVSDAGRAMLSDFGLSVVAMTNVVKTTAANHQGTINWMAPERLTADEVPPPTQRSDIWAFGRVDPEELRPSPDPDGVWPLMRQCLELEPEKRPSADEAHQFLVKLYVDDHRPPSKVEFTGPGGARASAPKIDYDRVLAILQALVPLEYEAQPTHGALLSLMQKADSALLTTTSSPLLLEEDQNQV